MWIKSNVLMDLKSRVRRLDETADRWHNRAIELEIENGHLKEMVKEAIECALDADPIRYAFLEKHLRSLDEETCNHKDLNISSMGIYCEACGEEFEDNTGSNEMGG